MLALTKELGLTYDEKIKQINFADERVYEIREGVYYPSATRILQYFPKGKFFEQWLKEVGTNADLILERAAQEGTATHDLIEAGIKTGKLVWLSGEGKAKCTPKVWEMVVRFHDFWKTYSPEAILVEDMVYSDEGHFAGTVDLVIKLDNEVWLLDIKTSNGLYRSYDLQVAAYAKALKECSGLSIDRAGIIWLKSKKRGPSRASGVYQGKGWEIREVKDIDDAYECFRHINAIYQYDNPKCEPAFKSFPTELIF